MTARNLPRDLRYELGTPADRNHCFGGPENPETPPSLRNSSLHHAMKATTPGRGSQAEQPRHQPAPLQPMPLNQSEPSAGINVPASWAAIIRNERWGLLQGTAWSPGMQLNAEKAPILASSHQQQKPWQSRAKPAARYCTA